MAQNLDTALPIVEKDEFGEYKATPYFEDYLHSIISSLGGEGAQPVSGNNEVNHAIDLPALMARIKQIEIDTMGFVGKVKTSNYTAIAKDWVEARSGVTITLPANPLVDEQVIVSNGDGSSITVSGNGNNIKFTTTETSLITTRQGSSFLFQYFNDNIANERYWRAR